MSADLLIRRATPADVAAITEIYNEAILTTTATFDIEPKTTADRAEWLEAHEERFPVFVAEVDGRVLGWTSLTRWSERAGYDDTAETALYVHSAQRSRGIGRRLKAALIDEARRLGFRTLIVRVTEDSEASLHLNRDAGFVLVGTLKQAGRKFGRLLDVHIMQKMLD
jgi:phosphinothricin acetyltransferase